MIPGAVPVVGRSSDSPRGPDSVRGAPDSARESLLPRVLHPVEARIERWSARHRVSHRALGLVRMVVLRDTVSAASAMAFDLFLAAVPMLAVSGWLFGEVLQNSDPILRSTSALLHLTPSDVEALVWQQLDRFAVEAFAPIALLGALWIASGAFYTSMSLLERASNARRRAWWKKRLIALACVLTSIAAFAAATVAAVWLSGGPQRLLQALSAGTLELAPTVEHALLLLMLGAVSVLLLAAFFRFAIERPGVRRRVFPGAVVSVTASGLVSLGFAYYAQHLARFALFYGALSAVAVMLAWLWLVCFAVLAGAELNLLLEDGTSDVA